MVADSKNRTLWCVLILSLALLNVGCSDEEETNHDPTQPVEVIDDPQPDPDPEPEAGATEFVSADGANGEDPGTQGGGDGATTDTAAPEAGADEMAGDSAGGGESRSVEEGDIYRLADSGLLINLNAYRGLQLIDISNPDAPHIVGGARISGSPVELYVQDDMVYVLMNHWRGYYGSIHEPQLVQREGGVVAAIDISDRTAPVIVHQAHIPGTIETSRLTRGGGASALYVVASGWNLQDNSSPSTGAPTGIAVESDSVSSGGVSTVVKSFDVTGGELSPRSQLDLGGYVSDIQATTQALLVARNNYYGDEWEESGYRSRVALVDISDPNGTMVEGAEALIYGHIRTQFNMDIHGDVLRVVSGSGWGFDRTNYVQTFNVADMFEISQIDQAEFGDNEDLYATLFVGNKAFFVTYFRTDPFHAFYIGNDGMIEEMSEYIVSGWNDFFRPVFDDTRLIGIGTNDEDGRTMAVSLYDITNLSNPTPLIERAEVSAQHSWSEASWDHRAFSVIEGVDGGVETGMVLLPYQGWSEDDGYSASVQIFTFSENTLTQRGVMHHGTSVRRSFGVDEGVTGNLSEAELSLFSTTNPDAPSALGRVELAPNYTSILTFGEYNVRVKSSQQPGYWYYNGGEQPNVVAQVISAASDADSAETLASIELAPGSTVLKVQHLVVGVRTAYTGYDEENGQEWTTTFEVFDFSNVLSPSLVSTFETNAIAAGYGGYYGHDGDIAMEDCFDCGGYYYGPSLDARNFAVIPGGIAFLKRDWQNELLGTEEVCQTYATNYSDCDEEGSRSTPAPSDEPDAEPDAEPDGEWGESSASGGGSDSDEESDSFESDEPVADGGDSAWEDCGYYTGSIICRSLNGAEPVCSGEINYCADDATTGEWDCHEIDPESIETQSYCWDNDRYRYWEKFSLIPLDLTTPSAPTLGGIVELAEDDEGVSMLVEDSTIWLSYKRPEVVADTALGFVRYYIQNVELENPSSPEMGIAVNVPGELIAKAGDELFTRDFLYGESIVETGIGQLRLGDGVATLEAYVTFPNQLVQAVKTDGAGRLLVTHRESWQTFEGDWSENVDKLTILDTQAELAVLGVANIDRWATLQDARDGRALYVVPGGVLIFNFENAQSPYPQAYFATQGWPLSFAMLESTVMFAAGPFGIYTFDLNTFNLLSQED